MRKHEPEVRSTLIRLDAFTVRGSAVVYIVRQSALLRGAVDVPAFHSYALASVIWHEMAYCEGKREHQARRQEEELWMRFIRDQ